LHIANLGDSRAVLFRNSMKKDGNTEKLAIELSYDHKPTRKDEQERSNIFIRMDKLRGGVIKHSIIGYLLINY